MTRRPSPSPTLALAAMVCLCLTMVACGEHTHGPGDHAHGHTEPAEDPRPGQTVTLYQGALELFMEYPAFVVGAESPLVAHFTQTTDPEAFRPVVRGRVTATLRHKDGTEETFVADKNLRDGIFKPIVRPTRAGEAELSLVLEGDQIAGRVDVGPVVVHPNTAAAVAAEPEETPTAEQSVPYLKEQQWKTRYATAAAEVRAVRASVRVFGELRSATGREVELAAPVSGRVEVVGAVPRVGQAVRRGELFLTIAPAGGAGGADRSGLELEERRARAELGLAERERERARALFASQAIPERQVDAARVAVEVAEARLRATTAQLDALRSAQSSLGQGRGAAFDLRAPLDGVVAHSAVMPGAFVLAGAPLVTVVDPRELRLVAHVPEQDLSALGDLDGASFFRVHGQAAERTLGMDRHLGTAPTVDPATRTAAVAFTVDNAAGELRPGQAARVTLFRKAAAESVAVPSDAIVDDNGMPAVFLMDDGEAFFKRRVSLGARDGAWTAVNAGL
jgi:cobalt-zinc-cadmium efflux system membrane fusion protein